MELVLSDNPVKGTEIEIGGIKLIVPQLTLKHYTDQGAEAKIIAINKYNTELKAKSLSAIATISDIESKAQFGTLTDEDLPKAIDALNSANANIAIDRKILDMTLDLVIMALKRNYPEITKEYLMNDMDLEMSDLAQLLSLVQTQDQTAKKYPPAKKKKSS